MVKVKIVLIACLSVFLTIGLSGTALAFHGGGVAHCDGCHTMHNSADNPVGDGATTNSKLLKGTDASSTCLNCHNGAARYHVASDNGANTNQGGDFFWVANPYTVTVRGTPTVFGGDDAGHNIIAADFGFTADANPNNATAPGGTYMASKLGCTSCHDAHGQVLGGTKQGQPPISVSGSYGAVPAAGTIAGNYRILGDSAYTAGDFTTDGYAFSNDAPIARSNNYDGKSVDYGSGMSEWCANCHNGFLVGSTAAHKHPSGDLVHLNGQATNYNSYVATGDFTGTPGNSYDSLVPFETGAVTGSTLKVLRTGGADVPIEGTAGPDGNSNVMCLTCHRAHASANPNAGRWDFEVELLEESHALHADAGSVHDPATAAIYYKDGTVIDVVTEYGAFQRSLCNKCHVQD